MFDKLEAVEARFVENESRLARPDPGNKPGEFRKLSQEHSSLQEIVAEYRRYKTLQKEIRSARELLGDKDPELSAMAKEELKQAEPDLEESKKRLQILLLPKDPNDEKNIM